MNCRNSLALRRGTPSYPSPAVLPREVDDHLTERDLTVDLGRGNDSLPIGSDAENLNGKLPYVVRWLSRGLDGQQRQFFYRLQPCVPSNSGAQTKLDTSIGWLSGAVRAGPSASEATFSVDETGQSRRGIRR
ncbi:hypothetical protein BCEP4_650004 [Burkholderia cepacia]|nr:hypothetical protein BCEP4_650004 [Burkholderia cepacia]